MDDTILAIHGTLATVHGFFDGMATTRAATRGDQHQQVSRLANYFKNNNRNPNVLGMISDCYLEEAPISILSCCDLNIMFT